MCALTMQMLSFRSSPAIRSYLPLNPTLEPCIYNQANFAGWVSENNTKFPKHNQSRVCMIPNLSSDLLQCFIFFSALCICVPSIRHILCSGSVPGNGCQNCKLMPNRGPRQRWERRSLRCAYRCDVLRLTFCTQSVISNNC